MECWPEFVGELERVKSAAAASQARHTARLDELRRAGEAARGVPGAKRGRGLASEIALARHDSPNRGGRHLGFARALTHEMPHTLAALEIGALSEWRATLIVRESACLDVEDRRIRAQRTWRMRTVQLRQGGARLDSQCRVRRRWQPHSGIHHADR